MLYIAYEHSYQYGTFNKSTSIINRKLRFCGPGGGRCGFAAQEENARGVVWVFLGALNRCFGPTEISRIRIRIRVALLIAQQRFWALATVQS